MVHERVQSQEFTPKERFEAIIGTLPERNGHEIATANALDSYSSALNLLNNVAEVFDLRLKEAQSPLESVQKALDSARQKLNETQERVKTGPDIPTKQDFPFILNQVRVLLGDQNIRLPLFLRPLRAFGISEHPDLTAARSAFYEAQREFNQVSERVSPGITKLEQKRDEAIGERAAQVKTAERQMFEVLDARAAQSIEVARRYVGELPTRVNAVALIITRAIEMSEPELSEFNDFLIDTLNIKGGTSPEQIQRTHGRTYPFLMLKRAPTPEEFATLPQRIRELWRNTRRKKVLRLLGFQD